MFSDKTTGTQVTSPNASQKRKRSISKTAKAVAAKMEEEERAAAKAERVAKKIQRTKKKDEVLKAAEEQKGERPRPRPTGRRRA